MMSTVSVPPNKLVIKAIRSSGPGGQNVNKVNTCVEIRFVVDKADWLPEDARRRLKEQQFNRMNKKSGEMILQCQEERTQTLNKKRALVKLQEIVDLALIEPKERNAWNGISEQTKQRRKDQKRYKSQQNKSGRISKDDW